MEQDTLRLAEQALIDAALRMEADWKHMSMPLRYRAAAAVVERASYLRGVRKAHADREATR